MPRASKQQARYAVGRCLMLWSSNDVTQQGSRPKTKLSGKQREVLSHVMEAGLPLLAISVIASCVLSAWLYGGPGIRSRRLVVAAAILGGLALCWCVLFGVGILHPAGAAAAGAGFVLSISALVVPWLWRRLPSLLSGTGSAAQQSAPADVLVAASRRQGRG